MIFTMGKGGGWCVRVSFPFCFLLLNEMILLCCVIVEGILF